MVRDYFFAALEGEAASKVAQMPSLMQEAKQRGYAVTVTVCCDGVL